VLGVTTNADFLAALLRDPQVAAGTPDTQLIARSYADWKTIAPAASLDSPELVAAVLALALQPDGSSDPASRSRAAGAATVATPWDTLRAWRTGTAAR
jgi:acetyl/propionyl-CoA carboxylase alpha subunit